MEQFMCGQNFYLRELRLSDLEGSWYKWSNDQDVTKYGSRGVFPNSIEKQRKYFDSVIDNPNQVVFAIVEYTNNHIGGTSLNCIDWVNRRAEIALVIGEKEYWGKGIGSEVIWLMTRYGFKVLNLHSIYAGIFADNIASIKMCEKSGYKKNGITRQAFYKCGKYLDGVYMDILMEDFIDKDAEPKTMR